MKRFFGVLPLMFILVSTAGFSATFSGIGFVNDDGSLRVAGRTVHLYGIYIPETDEACHTFVRPVRCGQQAALALEFKVDGFVHCLEKSRRDDGSMVAQCRVGVDPFSSGEDLSEYLLRLGWAVALPDAPFEYHTLERIARYRGLGVWGYTLVPRR